MDQIKIKINEIKNKIDEIKNKIDQNKIDQNLIYIKFTNKTIIKIEKYYHLLEDIKIYHKFTIIIWIYCYDTQNTDFINNLKIKFPFIKFINNFEVHNYLSNNELTYIDTICKNLAFCNETGKSHLTCYFIGKKFDYLINLDGDDMFYPNFKVEYFEQILSYMKNNKLIYLTRPFWICFDINFKASFGFTITSNKILDYLDLKNNMHIITKFNLDQTFSEILTNVKHHTYGDIHFELKDYNWSYGEVIEPSGLIIQFNAIETRKYEEHSFIINNKCHII